MRNRCIGLLSAIILAGSTSLSQWVELNGPRLGTVKCFQMYGTNLYAGTWGGGVFLSADSGTTWGAMNFGLTYTDVRSFLLSSGYLFVGTGGGIFRSADSGATWVGVDSGLTNGNVQAFAAIGSRLIAGTGGGAFVSVDSGTSWTVADSGLTDVNITALAVMGTNLYAGTGGGVFVSSDSGTSWSQTLFHSAVNALAISGTSLYAGTGTWSAGGGVSRSTDGGSSWSGFNSGLANTPVQAFTVRGANLFAGGTWISGGGVYVLPDSGTGWVRSDSGLTDSEVTALGTYHGDLLAGTVSGKIWRRPLSEMITSVDPAAEELPGKFGLSQNYPNPFNPRTRIELRIQNSEFLVLKVFDSLGREVSTLLNEVVAPGVYQLEFNGAGLASGVYYCRLQSGESAQTRQMLLLK